MFTKHTSIRAETRYSVPLSDHAVYQQASVDMLCETSEVCLRGSLEQAVSYVNVHDKCSDNQHTFFGMYYISRSDQYKFSI